MKKKMISFFLEKLSFFRSFIRAVVNLIFFKNRHENYKVASLVINANYNFRWRFSFFFFPPPMSDN